MTSGSRSCPQLCSNAVGGESTAHRSPQPRSTVSTARNSRPAWVSSYS